jgi:hypothetical protein
MKNTILKTLGKTVLAVLMMMTLALVSASAQQNDIINESNSAEQKAEDSSAELENNRKLEGSWNHTGTRLNCTTGAALGTFVAMFTFNQGGTFWESGTQIGPALRSPSHGVWSHESKRLYNTSFQFFRFNADGTLAGRQIIRQQIELSQDGNTYTATATAQVLDANGNVIANNCSSGTGTRFE